MSPIVIIVENFSFFFSSKNFEEDLEKKRRRQGEIRQLLQGSEKRLPEIEKGKRNAFSASLSFSPWNNILLNRNRITSC